MAPISNGFVDSAEFDWDGLFDVLSSYSRRSILQYLEGQERPISVHRLVREVSARHGNVPAGSIGTGDPEGNTIELDHIHLPKLEAAGLVVYDRGRHTVTLSPTARDLPLFSPLNTGLIHVDTTRRSGA